MSGLGATRNLALIVAQVESHHLSVVSPVEPVIASELAVFVHLHRIKDIVVPFREVILLLEIYIRLSEVLNGELLRFKIYFADALPEAVGDLAHCRLCLPRRQAIQIHQLIHKAKVGVYRAIIFKLSQENFRIIRPHHSAGAVTISKNQNNLKPSLILEDL